MKKHIPNIITCCNLLCGAVAVIMAVHEAFTYAFALMLLDRFYKCFSLLLECLVFLLRACEIKHQIIFSEQNRNCFFKLFFILTL